MRSRLPDGVKLIAENDCGTKIVYEYNGHIYLRGFGNTDYVYLNKDEWNDFANVIIKATKVINGEEKE